LLLRKVYGDLDCKVLKELVLKHARAGPQRYLIDGLVEKRVHWLPGITADISYSSILASGVDMRDL
jgi:hypothetical protein